MANGDGGEGCIPKLRDGVHPYQKTREAQEFENQAAIVCYGRLSEFGFEADCFKSFKENMAAFGDWWAQRKSGNDKA